MKMYRLRKGVVGVMNNKSELLVNGYCFGTAEDAETARQEVKKIEYLEQHMDYGKPENLLMVYQKAVESRIFQTPIGWEYLKELQGKLLAYDELKDRIPPITMYTVFAHRIGDEIKVPASRLKTGKRNPIKRYFAISVLINIMMAAAVIAMFVITLTSDNPNILNYENRLVDRYASWEQELSERENAIREKERKLMIEE